ncbi:MAG: pyridoxamine 5'-phosphate oxidase family protein [Pseudomonadales bacterium]|nr:pyridoxamine 5'-phosphate oxidase family protein [Pseudomonadales bacterium]MDP7357009.1 pyridoxamine 5'-phosphate oxidase family protein [Pseudomonadales bacterium]MDP7596063.1 pyridoxamine 5'-phosphate oxidase family protein [Pseudomonadales bacterium]HJN50552.1 pyridoxamine 5'-phosphate oxidase family protein [Pseudomonadales bacterium]
MIEETATDPMAEFMRDHGRARKLLDQNADVCFLATHDPQDGVQVRTLVLRDIVERKLGIFLNRSSPKWNQLEANGEFQLLLYYPSIELQYRMSGTHAHMDSDLVADSWLLRPDGSKYLDYYYDRIGAQSTRVDSREAMESALAKLQRSLPEPDGLTAPESARGLYLEIDTIDRLDLSDRSRLHDRRLFTFAAGRWTQQVLVP